MCLFEILNNEEEGWKTESDLPEAPLSNLSYNLPHAKKSRKTHPLYGSIVKQSFQINSIQAELLLLNTSAPYLLQLKPAFKFTGFLYSIQDNTAGAGSFYHIPDVKSGVYYEVGFDNEPESFIVPAGDSCYLIVAPNSAMIQDFFKLSPELLPLQVNQFNCGEKESKLLKLLLKKKNSDLEQSIILHRLMLCHLQFLESKPKIPNTYSLQNK